MAFAVYPSTLPVPEIAVTGNLGLPLNISGLNEIGAFSSSRSRTRASYTASSILKLDSDQVETFLTWHRVTMNDGIKKFTADWIELLGIKGYVGRITTFDIGLDGVKPRCSIQLEFIPWVQYDSVNTTIPSPWPNIENA